MAPSYPIEEGFRDIAAVGGVVFRRAEFRDPVATALENIPLSRRIDRELDRLYGPDSAGRNVISRVFRRLRGLDG